MIVGSIGYATKSGLGILLHDFQRHGVVNRVLVVTHPHYHNHPSRYGEGVGFDCSQCEAFLQDLDVLLLFETGFHWDILNEARRRNIPIVLMPMYEWTPTPFPIPIDLYLCPSLLDLERYKSLPAQFIPVPVEVPFRLRSRARHFIHNAGHGGTNWRNGTPELVQALRYVKSPIRLTLRGQPNFGGGPGEGRVQDLLKRVRDPRVEVVLDDVPFDTLWEDGDVFVFPEKFNGLSLPLQEAYASGMLVMASRRFPMTTWLPNAPLIPVARTERKKIAVPVDSAVIDPQAIAELIDRWYDADISAYSLQGREWADENSWAILGPRYLELLEGVACRSC